MVLTGLSLSTQSIKSSNLERIVQKGPAIATNLSQTWTSSDFDEKRKLQSLVFPEGIIYSKEKDRVQTTRVNSLFEEIPDLVSDPLANKNGHSEKSDRNARLVVPLEQFSNHFIDDLRRLAAIVA